MLTLTIAVTVGLTISIAWTQLGLWGTWILGSFLGLIGFGVTNFLIARKTVKTVQGGFEKATKLAHGGQTQRAISALQELLPYAKWQVMLAPQLHAQIGILEFARGEEEAALDHLQKSSPRLADAQLFRASILYRRDRFDEAKQVLEKSIKRSKKQMMPYNLLAWFHQERGDSGAALEVLQRAIRVQKDNEATRENADRIANGRKMTMKPFGDSWYALGFQKPAAVMGVQQAPVRKGFRQPPRKQSGKANKPKRKR